MASILSLAGRVFRTRNPARDATTDRDRLLAIRTAVLEAIEGATRERDGLRQRVDDYYAQASHLLDQSEYGKRSPKEEQAIVEAERYGALGLRRIEAINAQLQRFGSILDVLGDENGESNAA